LVTGLVLLSGVGTLLATSLSQPSVVSSGDAFTVKLKYHSLNPGPFAADTITVRVTLVGPDGVFLASSGPQAFGVDAFATAGGNLTFAMNFSALPRGVVDSFRNGAGDLTLSIWLSSGLSGLVNVSVVSNLTLSGAV
jgi:hypothetical protein